MNLCLSLIVLFVKYESVGQEWSVGASTVPVKICSGEVEWEDGKRAMLMILYHCVLPGMTHPSTAELTSNVWVATHMHIHIALQSGRFETVHMHGSFADMCDMWAKTTPDKKIGFLSLRRIKIVYDVYVHAVLCVCSYAEIRGFLRLAKQTGEVIQYNTRWCGYLNNGKDWC